jgi:hypothetical protein
VVAVRVVGSETQQRADSVVVQEKELLKHFWLPSLTKKHMFRLARVAMAELARPLHAQLKDHQVFSNLLIPPTTTTKYGYSVADTAEEQALSLKGHQEQTNRSLLLHNGDAAALLEQVVGVAISQAAVG